MSARLLEIFKVSSPLAPSATMISTGEFPEVFLRWPIVGARQTSSFKVGMMMEILMARIQREAHHSNSF
jgi:hypothetical protein